MFVLSLVAARVIASDRLDDLGDIRDHANRIIGLALVMIAAGVAAIAVVAKMTSANESKREWLLHSQFHARLNPTGYTYPAAAPLPTAPPTGQSYPAPPPF